MLDHFHTEPSVDAGQRRLAESNRCFTSEHAERVNDPQHVTLLLGRGSRAEQLTEEAAREAASSGQGALGGYGRAHRGQDPQVGAAHPEESQTPAGGPFGQRATDRAKPDSTRKSRPLTIYDVDCPYCGSDVGDYCRTSSGRMRVPGPHEERRRAFKDAAS